jgi:hypothetical protein
MHNELLLRLDGQIGHVIFKINRGELVVSKVGSLKREFAEVFPKSRTDASGSAIDILYTLDSASNYFAIQKLKP